MFGNCPHCKQKIRLEELKKIKNGEGARCFGCGKLYVNEPLFSFMLFLLMVFFPFVIPYCNSKILIILCMVLTFILAVFYNEIKIRLPLIEENSL